MPTQHDGADGLVAAVSSGDLESAREILAQHPSLTDRLDDALPGLPFGGTVLLAAVQRGDRAMVDLLLESGAGIDQRSHWWAGGFGVLDGDHDLHDYLISRGATVDAHAAARLGRIERLRELLDADPTLATARGGDGQTPLHVAASVPVAELLLDRGADIDALDVDHESTPAQYLVRDRPDVARFLLQRGCRTDLMLTSALGDLARIQAHLEANPDSIRMTISDRWFPMRNPRAGGHIYRWMLGANRSAHQVAYAAGHPEAYELLMSRSTDTLRLVVACRVCDRDTVGSLLADNARIAQRLEPSEQRALADAAKDFETAAATLMLDAGWPLAVPGDDGGTPLHWAAWHGNAELTSALLGRGAPITTLDPHYRMTPLGWALHGSLNSWERARGDHAAVVDALLDAGGALPEGNVAASDAVLAVLRRR